MDADDGFWFSKTPRELGRNIILLEAKDPTSQYKPKDLSASNASQQGGIDYKFISDLEGGSKIVGYVPAIGVSKSGVTIATGFDLGQRNENDLTALKLNTDLILKLKPYLGVKRADAQTLLKKQPLTITSNQAQAIDKAVKSAHISQLKSKYDSMPGNKKKFVDIPSEAQTVIASVSFQYGVGLDIRTPKFWKAVTTQNWPEAVEILKSFGDAYPTRRKKEAALMEKIK